jgi:hypothetical protein
MAPARWQEGEPLFKASRFLLNHPISSSATAAQQFKSNLGGRFPEY